MQVAVVLLNWNTRHLLEQFLPEVLKYSQLPGVEVVVADNGSSDDSLSWLKTHYPAVRCIALGKNLGFAEGYNQALAKVDAQYSVLFNSDALPRADWLPPLIATMQKHPDAAACVPKILNLRQPGHFEYAGAAGGFIDHLGYTFCRGRIFHLPEADQGQYDEEGELFWGSGAALMVRTRLFLASGGLDPDFFAHMEEIDWCWRMKNQGWRILYQPQSSILHLGGGTLDYQNARKTYFNFRNNLFLLLKNQGGTRAYLLILLRFFLDFLALLNFLRQGQSANAAAVSRAHRHFIKDFWLFYRKRQKLLPLVLKKKHHEMYRGSIVWDFFVRKKKHFSQLNFKPPGLKQ